MDSLRAIIDHLPFIAGVAGQPKMSWTRFTEAIIIGAFAAGVVYTKINSDIETLAEKIDSLQAVVDQAHPRH